MLILHFVESVLGNSYDFNIGVWGWPKKKDQKYLWQSQKLTCGLGTGYG